jgi:hypothetical protein
MPANSQKHKKIDHLHDVIDPWKALEQEQTNLENKKTLGTEISGTEVGGIASLFHIEANFHIYEVQALKLNDPSLCPLRHGNTDLMQYQSIAIFAGEGAGVATKTDNNAVDSNSGLVGTTDKIEHSEIVFHDGPQEFFQVYFPFQNNDRFEALLQPLAYRLA